MSRRRRALPPVGALLLLALAQSAQAQIPSLQSGLSYRFDVRQVTESDILGLDFSFQYTRERARATPQGLHASLDAALRGFTTFDPQRPEVNVMQAQVALSGRYYRSTVSAPLATELQMRMEDLLDRDAAGGGTGLGRAEEKELNDLIRKNSATRVFVTFDAHYRMEASQDLDDRQWALGAGVGAEVPLLGGILDVFADATRDSSSFRPQPVRMYAGFDHVTPGTSSPGDGDSAENGAEGWRSRVEFAWDTRVLRDLVFRANWEAQYMFGVGDAARDSGFTDFLQLWLKLPLTAQTGVIIKYLSGELPPTFSRTDGATIGMSIAVY